MIETAVLIGIVVLGLVLYWKSIKVDDEDEGERLKIVSVIEGKAFVNDGDGIRLMGKRVRIADIDAPEKEQQAKLPDGRWVDEGKRVKSALIRKVGGKKVRVTVEGIDQYGRVLGMVTLEGEDIGKWLVGKGYAVAAYSNRYVTEEATARDAGRGRWSYAKYSIPMTGVRARRRGRTGNRFGGSIPKRRERKQQETECRRRNPVPVWCSGLLLWSSSSLWWWRDSDQEEGWNGCPEGQPFPMGLGGCGCLIRIQDPGLQFAVVVKTPGQEVRLAFLVPGVYIEQLDASRDHEFGHHHSE